MLTKSIAEMFLEEMKNMTIAELTTVRDKANEIILESHNTEKPLHKAPSFSTTLMRSALIHQVSIHKPSKTPSPTSKTPSPPGPALRTMSKSLSQDLSITCHNPAEEAVVISEQSEAACILSVAEKGSISELNVNEMMVNPTQEKYANILSDCRMNLAQWASHPDVTGFFVQRTAYHTDEESTENVWTGMMSRFNKHYLPDGYKYLVCLCMCEAGEGGKHLMEKLEGSLKKYSELSWPEKFHEYTGGFKPFVTDDSNVNHMVFIACRCNQ
jgi:hypothetical protein